MAGGRMGRAEKLMSRLLCDGACLLRCQAASLRTHLKTVLFFISLFQSSLFLSPPASPFFTSFLTFLSLSLADSIYFAGTGKKKKKTLAEISPPPPAKRKTKN